MRRSRLRLSSSFSSHCSSVGSHTASAISFQCAITPCKRNAHARCRKMSVLIIVQLREGIVGIEAMGLYENVFGAHVFGKRNDDRRRLPTRFSPFLQYQTYGVLMWGIMREGFLDCGLQLSCPKAIEQLDQSERHRADVASAFSRANKQFFARWDGGCQAVFAAMLARVSFEGHKLFDMRRVFNLRMAGVTARVLGDAFGTVEDAHTLRRRAHGHGSLHMRMRYAVVVEIKPRIRRLAD